jgi:hypothetical protein
MESVGYVWLMVALYKAGSHKYSVFFALAHSQRNFANVLMLDFLHLLLRLSDCLLERELGNPR